MLRVLQFSLNNVAFYLKLQFNSENMEGRDKFEEGTRGMEENTRTRHGHIISIYTK